MARTVATAFLLLLSACGTDGRRELTQPCEGTCNPGLSCVSVNFIRVCLIEVTNPQLMRPNGDPMCPAGTAGFQTMSGVMGSTIPPEHHALCAPLCEGDGDCFFGNKCLMITYRPEAAGERRGLCLPQ
jgi:hypothetical protein